MTEARKPLNIHKIQIQDCLATMAEGNIGALNVLMALSRHDFNGFVAILDLDDMNMRGEQIWIAFKYHCDQSIAKLMELCRNRDKAMVDHVNREHKAHVAVQLGGSSRESQVEIAVQAD